VSDEKTTDIPPALSDEQWARGEYRTISVRATLQGQSLEIVDREIHEPGIADVSDAAALVALLNELLRRFDDPRAVTRQHVDMLRAAAFRIEQIIPTDIDRQWREEKSSANRETRSQLLELADVFESYLPPESSVDES